MLLYTNLELPISLFFEISSTDNYYRLSVFGSLIPNKLKGLANSYLMSTWAKIYDEYIKLYGLSDDYKKYIQLKLDINDLWIERWRKNERFIENFIDMKELDLKKLEKTFKSTGKELDDSCSELSKFMGFQVNPNNISVRQFYAYRDQRVASIKMDQNR